MKCSQSPTGKYPGFVRGSRKPHNGSNPATGRYVISKLSCWVGILEVKSECFTDNTPIFYKEDAPFIIRFRVEQIVWLAVEKAIPIREDRIWKMLSFTAGHAKHSSEWTGKVRASLTALSEQDGAFLEAELTQQVSNLVIYPVDDAEYQKLIKQRVRRADKSVTVSIPSDTAHDTEVVDAAHVRDSIKYQALLAGIRIRMGFNIWIPRNDKNRVAEEVRTGKDAFLDVLPLNYDDATLKTIEQIDVIWLKKRAIARAFEVEHTTSIYSGILRMADLIALQPNIDIKLHIVAPASRREKVFQEIQRPVFSLLEKGALSDYCTFISYDSVDELAKLKHLTHLSDSVIEEYAEEVE
ncbi:MAG: hypothetical protein HPY76_00220 [Anaerolineae bacterium]|nr:hypothetical protein [Anaerolineae bacterium]